jgi:aryl-alcohol dehydrogenase-like predicted oxidoreductase
MWPVLSRLMIIVASKGGNPKHPAWFHNVCANPNLAIVDKVEAVAARHDATAAQVALAWTLAQGEHASAADLRLTADDLAELDALPTPAGTRY